MQQTHRKKGTQYAMQSWTNTYPLEGGIQLFTQGRFWPIGLVAIDEFEASLLVPDELVLAMRERVTLKIGTLPSFPAVVRSMSEGVVCLIFLGAVHPKVISLLETGKIAGLHAEPIAA